jgi:hypothetical protein
MLRLGRERAWPGDRHQNRPIAIQKIAVLLGFEPVRPVTVLSHRHGQPVPQISGLR